MHFANYIVNRNKYFTQKYTLNSTDTNQGSFQDQRIFVFGDTPVIFYGKEAENMLQEVCDEIRQGGTRKKFEIKKPYIHPPPSFPLPS